MARSRVQASDPHRHAVRETTGRFTKKPPADAIPPTPAGGTPPGDPPPTPTAPASGDQPPRPAIIGALWSRGLGALRHRSDG